MRFGIGDRVLVASLGKGVIREVRKGGRCLVEIKGRSLLVDEQQLSPVEARQVDGQRAAPPQPKDTVLPSRAHAESIDLHGMTAAEAETALVTFINEAILGGTSEVRVIHGRSGGRLKVAVQRQLQALPSIRGFRLDPANPGVTIVTL
jgi:dsDNA-specific endonuclease/ATPase MutS2